MAPVRRASEVAGADVHVIDLRYLGLSHAIAAFLVRGPDGPVLVETGPASTIGELESGLSVLGIALGDLAGALVTHIHLDHSGAAGHLATLGVPIFVHPRGFRHLVDPSRLLASAGRIYGDRLEEMWGQTVAAPESMVSAVEDGDVIDVGGLSFTAMDTPGHARHHHVYRLGDAAFCGDVAGVRLPHSDLVAVPAVPPEFDPAAWRTSIDRLQSSGLRVLLLTHFGSVDTPAEHLGRLREELDAMLEFVTGLHADGMSLDAMTDRYVAWSRGRAQTSGVDGDALERFEAANPFGVSVGGIVRYLESRS